MAQYNLTNWWVVFQYTVSSIIHTQKFSVASSAIAPDVPSNVLGNRKAGGQRTFQDFANAWTIALAPRYEANASTFVSMELWFQPDTAETPTFITAADSTQFTQPSAVGNNTRGSQQTLTFRDTNSRTFKIVLLDSRSVPHSKYAYDALPAELQTIMDFVVGGSSPILSRANNYIATPRFGSTTFNDALTRKYFGVS